MIKVWPLIDNKSNDLRIVVLNKLPTEAANVTIALDAFGPYSAARVIRLTAEGV